MAIEPEINLASRSVKLLLGQAITYRMNGWIGAFDKMFLVLTVLCLNMLNNYFGQWYGNVLLEVVDRCNLEVLFVS